MPKAKKQEFGIDFVTEANKAGYEWQQWFDPQWRQNREVLAVRDEQVRPDATTVIFKGGIQAIESRYGLDNARRAFNAFVRIGRTADALQRYDAIQSDASGNVRLSFQGQPLPSPPEARGELMPMIAEFACTYGSLLGDDEPLTLKEWTKEAREFHQLVQVSRMLRTGDYEEFERRIHIREDEVIYGGPVGRRTVARRGDVYEGRERNARTKIDFFAVASSESPDAPRKRAWMLFSRGINRNLRGGLSLAVHSLNDRTARVEPRHLLHLLYLRLCLDTINGEPLERDLTCRHCGKEIHGRRSKRYCDDTCRNAFHNRRRTIQG